MAGKIRMAARAEVTEVIRERYAASGKVAKGAILDEFVAMTGVHRKHAIRLLTGTGSERRPRGRPKARYGRAVVNVGPWVEPPGGYAGAKIAFNRIPDDADF